ncbi:PREDICTED: vomeronasal type-2 receptor 116-like [Nanorana parkeri]|uniref:vomeronasal type-2 receptor 116-like n=1 Tax=Nanorana parkeri TaxID=125878 RepID=UPI00085478FF|nr:PREDICTED: vomeronasal type-2 receptor 116-like [Nanorana parkeri]
MEDSSSDNHGVEVSTRETLKDLTKSLWTPDHHTYYTAFLRRVHFRDPTGEEVFFNEKREMSSSYDIMTIGHVTDSLHSKYFSNKIGSFEVSSPEGGQLVISRIPIFWTYSEIPVSVCSVDCPPGYRRTIDRGRPRCCFHCVQCPVGEISNHTDKGSCQKCPEDQWPNDFNQCVPKPVEYLSYTGNPITFAIPVISGLFFSAASLILVIFIMYQDTPVIKANNRDLSFVLQVSIMLSFLSVFLFLGRPVHITCMLRHTVYGVLFSVAVSSILAKTMLVYMAFKATKPGTTWKKFIGVKIPICLVLICSLFQIVTSIIWLSVSPPFPEANTKPWVPYGKEEQPTLEPLLPPALGLLIDSSEGRLL